MFSFKSVGHFLAVMFRAAPIVIADIEKSKPVVDKVLPLVPGFGPIATSVADLGFAALGEVASVLTAGGDAAKAKLADAGLDINVLHAIEQAVAEFKDVAAALAALQAKAPVKP